MSLRRMLLAAVAASALLSAVAGADDSHDGARRTEAEEHYQRAMALLDRNTFDTRRVAIHELEQATLIEPGNASYQLTLARTYYRIGFLKSARGRFEKVIRMTPGDANGRFGLGQVWRRDWLKYLDRSSLQRAADQFSMAARLNPKNCDAWLMLVPLSVELNDLRAARTAASQALEAEPRRPEALMAVAYTAYRMGEADRADSAYAAVLPRLPKSVRERLEDISPVATERDTAILHHLPAPEQAEFVRRFWKDNDPDLATAQNEAQLEYWSRVAHAYFLFYNPKLREWDERGEIYVRYGPPQRTDYNPVGMSLIGWGDSPRNVMVWYYPELGMRVVMEDRLLSEYYLLPMARDHDPDPRPDPEVLAKNEGALATRDGRGVFPLFPPGVAPIPVDGALARFETAAGARLLAQVQTPGSPGDSLWAEWVVVDTARREVSRDSRPLAPSGCDVTELRAAEFAAELPAGAYQVGLTVRDSKGRRGVYRRNATLARPAADLALSDVVISCGSPSVSPGESVVRIEPNPSARVGASDPLTAYFEIYHLTPGSDGQSRFEYVYTVKSAAKDPRIWIQRLFDPRKQPNPIEVSREEENIGALRRQFVTVPVQSLPPGKYKLEIKVRDLIAGNEAVRSAEFVKVGVGELRN